LVQKQTIWHPWRRRASWVFEFCNAEKKKLLKSLFFVERSSTIER
jgi:hypothetical protein